VSKHLFGAVVTPHGIAANNRGEGEGNLTTLQKLIWHGEVHTTVSAEAIRWALRVAWQERGLRVNRTWDEQTRRHAWEDPDFAREGVPFIDDDVLGYMSAQAARQEAGEQPPADGGRARRPRGRTLSRRSRFEVTRAISLTPWPGDVVFNVAGIGATASASRTRGDPVPYSAEVHATRYQYGFALTPEGLHDGARALAVVDALVELAEVAGNHARFYYDFAPDAVVFRWTDDVAPRLLYPFRVGEDGALAVPELLRRVRAGDVDGGELVVGGVLADAPDGRALAGLGAAVFPGVKQAGEEAKARLRPVVGA
jgi:CRISPR-associated protein Cst2